MSLIGTIPRRCVNLPPGTLKALARCISSGKVREGPEIEEFFKKFGQWLGVPYVFGAFTGRSAFQLALEALALEKGKEIIFPAFTFPVIPMVARLLGYKPVFCQVDPETFNAGPEHIEARISDRTAAIVATHLFGQPCPIHEIIEIGHRRNIRVLEDCAHACGVKANGQRVGTFGDIGIFSFAEGKNMPCFGGGAIVTEDETIALRAKAILSRASIPENGIILKNTLSIWTKWLLTRPFIFGLSVYPVLRLRLLLGQALMDSTAGDPLLKDLTVSFPQISRFANLQALIGLLQLDHIDAFNEEARRNAHLLTEGLDGLTGVSFPRSGKGEHIFVYYPLNVKEGRRGDLRRYLLRHGIDSKITDMSDCSRLDAFRETDVFRDDRGALMEDSILEICVYPVISEKRIHRLAQIIRAWAHQTKKRKAQGASGKE